MTKKTPSTCVKGVNLLLQAPLREEKRGNVTVHAI